MPLYGEDAILIALFWGFALPINVLERIITRCLNSKLPHFQYLSAPEALAYWEQPFSGLCWIFSRVSTLTKAKGNFFASSNLRICSMVSTASCGFALKSMIPIKASAERADCQTAFIIFVSSLLRSFCKQFSGHRHKKRHGSEARKM